MLNIDKLVAGIDSYLQEGGSRAAFEDWFSLESWNVGQSGPQELVDLVAEIESLFSRYHYEGLSEVDLNRELANTIRPFAASSSLRVESRSGSSPIPDTLSLVKKGPQYSAGRRGGFQRGELRFA